MDTKRKGMDREKVIVSGILAIIESLGVLFLGMFVIGMVPSQCDGTTLISIESILFAAIWGILLCRNC